MCKNKKSIAVIAFMMAFFMFVAISMEGCSTAQINYTANVASISGEATILTRKYEDVRALIVAKKDAFPADQYQELITVDSTMTMLIQKIGDVTDPNKLKQFSLNDIIYMWQLAKDGYQRSYVIVGQNWDKLVPSEKMIVLSFKDSAEKTDAMITELLKNPDNASINQTIIMITGMAGIALKLLPLILV